MFNRNKLFILLTDSRVFKNAQTISNKKSLDNVLDLINNLTSNKELLDEVEVNFEPLRFLNYNNRRKNDHYPHVTDVMIEDSNLKIEEDCKKHLLNDPACQSPINSSTVELYCNNCEFKTNSKRDLKWHILQHSIEFTMGNVLLFFFSNEYVIFY